MTLIDGPSQITIQPMYYNLFNEYTFASIKDLELLCLKNMSAVCEMLVFFKVRGFGIQIR